MECSLQRFCGQVTPQQANVTESSICAKDYGGPGDPGVRKKDVVPKFVELVGKQLE